MSRARFIAVAAVMLVAPCAAASPAPRAGAGSGTSSYRDGHARPRALAFNPDDGLLYAALSTSDEVAIVDPAAAPAARDRAQAACATFPTRSRPLPGGGAMVACRFDAGLRRIRRARTRRLACQRAGGRAREAGRAGSPSRRAGRSRTSRHRRWAGSRWCRWWRRGGVMQTRATGMSPRAMRVVPAGTLPRAAGGAAAGQQLHRSHRDRARDRRRRPAGRRDPVDHDGRPGAGHARRRRRAAVTAAVHARGPAAESRASVGRGAGQRRHHAARARAGGRRRR